MATAIATYRRGRPRVEVDARWQLDNFWDGEGDGGPAMRNGFHIHAVNRGAMAVEAQSIHVELDIGPLMTKFLRGRRQTRFMVWLNRGRYYRNAVYRLGPPVEGGLPRQVDAFGGAHWLLANKALTLGQNAPWKKARVALTLTNGQVVNSPWVSVKKMRAADTRLANIERGFSRLMAETLEPNPDQLTLFDNE